MAPEFLEHKVFTERSEVYSFGILMYEVFCLPFETNKNPYGDLQGVQIMFQVINHNLRPKITDVHRSNVQEEILDLMQACWAKNPADRPTCQGILLALRGLLRT